MRWWRASPPTSKGSWGRHFEIVENLTRFLVLLFSSGCLLAHPLAPPANVFVESYPGVSREKLWQAALESLRDFGIKKHHFKKGTIQTAWITGWSDRPFGAVGGGILGSTWKRRFRFELKLREEAGVFEIRLMSFVEEKPPGGPRAYRWERVASNGIVEKQIFSNIRERAGTL